MLMRPCRFIYQKNLRKFEHPPPKIKQHTPYAPEPRFFGKDSQKTKPPDKSKPLTNQQKKRVQGVVGTFLYYARAVYVTILSALSNIVAQQASATANTKKKLRHIVDYLTTHPEAKIRFHASDMILNVHSDASYLSAPKGQSRAGGHFFLGSVPQDRKPIPLNAPIHTTCGIIHLVAASASEAKLAALFFNAKEKNITPNP